MDADEIVLLIAVAAVVVVVIALLAVSARRRRLRRQFGGEYDRTIDVTGSRRDAERELKARTERHDQLHIVPLSPTRRTQFRGRWDDAQARFVDEPLAAMSDADQLVQEVMTERGYPTGRFDQRASDLSVEHAEVIENYRKAHDIALDNERGRASTEDLRMAMVHYRAVFGSLLRDESDDRSTVDTDRYESQRRA